MYMYIIDILVCIYIYIHDISIYILVKYMMYIHLYTDTFTYLFPPSTYTFPMNIYYKHPPTWPYTNLLQLCIFNTYTTHVFLYTHLCHVVYIHNMYVYICIYVCIHNVYIYIYIHLYYVCILEKVICMFEHTLLSGVKILKRTFWTNTYLIPCQCLPS